MMIRSSIVCLVLVAAGCNVAAPEAAEAGLVLSERLQVERERFVDFVGRALADLEEGYDAQLRFVADREFARINAVADPDERARLMAVLLDDQQQKRRAYRARLDAKRAAYLDAEGWRRTVRLIEALNVHLRTQAEVSAALRALLDGELFRRPTSPPAETRRP